MVNVFRAWFRRLKDQAAVIEQLKAPLEELPGGQDQWIQDSMDWFVEQFGRDVLVRPIVLPSEFVPAQYDGSEAAARVLFEQVRERMGVPPGRLVVRFDLDSVDRQLDNHRARQAPQIAGATRMRFGSWMPGKDHNTIFISARLLAEPSVLVANFAHEIGHEVLLGSGRISVTRPDQESLTDLLVVFHGFGIFIANASFGRPPGGAHTLRMGMFYLRERALTDALAYYALMTDTSLQGASTMPAWGNELDAPVRAGLAARLPSLQETAGESAQPGK
jgi:hypothetical protein